jgi:hypothetical protein
VHWVVLETRSASLVSHSFHFLSRRVEEVQTDEFGIEMTVKSRKPAPLTAYAKNDVFVPPVLAKWLRPHQREGVQFMYECVMGMKDYKGNGCILADDMGLVSGEKWCLDVDNVHPLSYLLTTCTVCPNLSQ